MTTFVKDGDVPGHEFHGNQHTDGSGSVGHTPSPISGGESSMIYLSGQIDRGASSAQHDEIESALFSQYKNKLGIWEGGTIVGAVAFGVSDSGGNKFVELHHLGSSRKGAGTSLVNKVKEYADKKKLPIRLESSEEAQGFYEKLGFKREPGTQRGFYRPAKGKSKDSTTGDRMAIRKHLHSVAFDRGSARTVDEQGFLHVEGCNISKACVNPYWGSEIPDAERLGLDPGKIYMLFRDPKELAKAAETFNNLPLMDNHIEVSALDLEDGEIKKKIVGSTGTGARFEHPYLINDLVVWTAGGIEGVQSKKQTELSCAYRYELDMTPGEYEGQKYDGRMFNLRGNHVALVDEGRAGKDVVVKDRKLQVKIDLNGVAKALQDGLAEVKRKLGIVTDSSLATDCVSEFVTQLTSLKAEIESKLKPNVEGDLAQALDDATSAIDSAVHHLLDYQGDLSAEGGVTTEDDNPEGINQYTSGGGTANRIGKAAGKPGGPSHKDAQAAHQKAARLARKAGDPAKADAHLRVAAAHRALHESPDNTEAKAVLAGHYGVSKDSVVVEDADLLYDLIKHRPGHRDSKGNPAPWVIVSESTGKVIWSGLTEEDAVKQLKTIKGREAGGVTSEDDNPEGINQYTGGGASRAAEASKAANEASQSSQGRGEKGHREKSRLHHEAVKAHQAGLKEAAASGNKDRENFHNQSIKEHRDMVAHHEQKARRAAARGMDSVVADVAEREDVSPEVGKQKYGEVRFADPKNKKYPIDTPEHVRSALSYWGRAKNRNIYSKEDQDVITRNIEAAAKRFKIGEFAESK